ncbi:DUF2911 domain-containing protein [Membranihabitans marinus]|uniref:DUF2911 domain-containing protein n=1 Tax=Membranihabitans marinus TaxID=1227546 RepID=UPI001F3A744A|nr:DUF2911 domain-containing protein [Membranihabitans marinus]
MKNLLLILCFVVGFISISTAQSFRGIDRSPLDCAYFPDNFAHDRKGDDEAIMKIVYSRPSKKNREIFGDLIPFDKMWRTGANEAAEIKVYKTVTFSGKKLSAGTYSLFTIPGKSEWTIIFSKDLDRWGTSGYSEKKDALRITAPASQNNPVVENFSIQFFDNGNKSGSMKLAWDDTVVDAPFKY